MKGKLCIRSASPPERPFRRGLYHSISFTDHMDLVSTSADIRTDRDQSVDHCPESASANTEHHAYVKRDGDTDGRLISGAQLAPRGSPRLAVSPSSTTWLRPSANISAAAIDAAGGAAGGCDSGGRPERVLVDQPSPPPPSTAVGVGFGSDTTSRPPWSRNAATGTRSSQQLSTNPKHTASPTSVRINSISPVSSFTPAELVQRGCGDSNTSPGGVTAPGYPPCAPGGTGRTLPQVATTSHCHTPHTRNPSVTPPHTTNASPTTPKTHRIIATLTPNGLPLDYFCSPHDVNYPGVCNHGNTIERAPSSVRNVYRCGERGGLPTSSQTPGTRQKGLRRSKSSCGQAEARACQVNSSLFRAPPTPKRITAGKHPPRSSSAPSSSCQDTSLSSAKPLPAPGETLDGGSRSVKDSENSYSHAAQERDIWIPRNSLSSSYSTSFALCELRGSRVNKRPELSSSGQTQTSSSGSSRSLPSSPVRYVPSSRRGCPTQEGSVEEWSTRSVMMAEAAVVKSTLDDDGHLPKSEDDPTDQPDLQEGSGGGVSGETPRNPIILFQNAGGGKSPCLVPVAIDKNLSLTVYLRRWSAFHDQRSVYEWLAVNFLSCR